MINISNEVFTGITNALKQCDSSVKTSSVYTNSPTSYPFASIEEIDDSVYERGSDCCEIENFASKSYELNVYASGTSRLSKARELLEVADNYLKSIGFTRVSKTPMQDQNETIYRFVARYTAVVSKDKKVYRR